MSGAVGWVFASLAPPSRRYETRDRILALRPAITLLGYQAVWMFLVFVGFTGVFWGLDHPRLAAGLPGVGLGPVHPRLLQPGRDRPPGRRLRRGAHRADTAGPAHLLPAHHLRRLPATRGHGGQASVRGARPDTRRPLGHRWRCPTRPGCSSSWRPPCGPSGRTGSSTWASRTGRSRSSAGTGRPIRPPTGSRRPAPCWTWRRLRVSTIDLPTSVAPTSPFARA